MPIDYKSFERGSETALAAQASLGFWWKIDKKNTRDLATAVVNAGRHLVFEGAARTQDNIRHARLYGNFDFAGFGLRQYARRNSLNRIALNVVAACVDTLSSKIAKNRPKPSFQTFGNAAGPGIDIWKLQRKAKKLDKFCQGIFYECRTHEIGRECFRDACTLGTGVMHVFEADGRVKMERVLVDELMVDDADGVYGTPRQMMRRKSMAREVVFSQFGDTQEQRDAISVAKNSDELSTASQGFGDMIEVFEAWHLPSGPKAKDGRHTIACDGAVLLDEVWEKDYFPFAFLRYVSRISGFYGQGIPERLFGIQLELNRLIKETTETLRLMSKGRIFMQRGSQVVKAHLDNGIGNIIEFNGTPPVLANANAVPPEMFQQMDRLWERAFEHEGVSQLSASARKPAGLDSAPAQREYDDISSERFAVLGQSYEQFYVDIGRLAIDVAKEIASDGKDYEVNAPIRKVLEPVKWSEIKLNEDQYVMQAFPVSSLPTTPAARTQQVVEWIQQGWLDAVEGRRLMNMPDLESSDSLAVAALDDADMTVEKILDGDDKDITAPDKYQNLKLILSRGTAALLRARQQGAPQDRLDALCLYLELVAQQDMAANPPAPSAGPAAPPGLAPGAPPPPPGAGPMGIPVGGGIPQLPQAA